MCLLCCMAASIWLVASASASAGAVSIAGGSGSGAITGAVGTGGELSLDEGAGQQAAAEVVRTSPEAVASREASRTGYEHEDQAQAEQTFGEAFPAVRNEQDGGPVPLVAGEKSLGFEGANLEQIQTGSGEVGVVESTMPVAVASGGGRWSAVDLALREVGGGFEAQTPLQAVRIPKHLAEGADIPAVGVSITPVDEHGTPLEGSEGVVDGTAVLFANTQTDADTVLKPSSLGLEASTVLRSVESPEALYYLVGMPQGARLVASASGPKAEVMDEGVAIARINPPAATDAAGTPVPVSMSVSGDTLVVSVKHGEGNWQYPIMVDPELSGYWQEWSNVVAGNWEFHEWIGYTYEIAGAELRMKHEPGSFQENDYAIWSEKTKGYTKIFDVYVKDELYPWSSPEGKVRDTPHWLRAYMEMYRPGGGGTESAIELTGSPYLSEATVCGSAGCDAAGADAEGNAFSFTLTTNEAGSTGEQFYAHAEQVSTGVAQAYGKHSTVEYSHASKIEGAPNALGPNGGAWIGPHSGKLEYTSQDGGLGVAESWAEVDGTGGWTKMQDTNFMSSKSCTGIQCESKEREVLSYNSLTENGAKPLAEPEAHIRVSARSDMPYSSSNEHGEGEATLKVDTKPPHGITVSGLPAKGEGGKELTVGEGPAHLVAEASDGEGTTPSSGIKEIRLYVDGVEVGHGGGFCSEGPCTAAATWTLKGAEFGVGAHQMVVQAEGNTGELAEAEYTLNVYAASPVAAGPGSVNPESGDLALEAADVSLSGGTGSLALSRHYDSRELTAGEEGPFGPQWTDSTGSLASLEVLPNSGVMVIGPDGLTYFEAKKGGGFEAPKGDANLELSYQAEYEAGKPAYLFKDAKEDTTTVFMLPEHATSWMPVVSKGPTATNTTVDEYRTVEVSTGKWVIQPTLELAPHPNVECAKGAWHAGCRALEFVYYTSKTATGTETESEWGGYTNRLHEVIAVAYSPAAKEIKKTPVATYLYDSRGWLRAVWNPSISLALKTTYGYDAEGHLTAVTPAGQQPWLMHYGTTAQDTTPGRLLSIGRLGAKATGGSTPLKDSAVPTLSSTSPVIGTTISVTNGTWSTTAALFDYQWEDCNSSGAGCAVIPGAVNSTYTPQPRDAGYTLVVEVVAENGSGSVTAATGASKVVAMATPTYSSVFGTSGSESEKLKSPAGVADDSEGNVWVADLGSNRIEKFSSAGVFKASYAPDSMLEPAGIVFSPTNGDLYVTNRGRDRIDQLTTSGSLVRSFGSEGAGLGKLRYPNQVTVDSHGDVWVADTNNARVDEFSASGAYVGSVRGGSNGEHALEAPVGVAECGGTLYVSDWSAQDVQEIAVGGEYVGRIGPEGKEGAGNGEFSGPEQVACEPAGGDVYVADKGNGRIQEFSANGTFLDKFGSSGSGEGQLSTPVGVTVGPAGVVYVGDYGNNRISKWKPSYSTNNPLPTPPALSENPISAIEYNIPLSGTGLQTLTSSEVSKWAQKDDPEEGTAIFPPDEPMGWPAANYKRASISYVDEQMRTVNAVSPAGGISTTEYNPENEVTRSLSAENRAAAMKETNTVVASELLDTKSTYEKGELTSTLGPQHTVKLAKGKSEANETVLARNHVKYLYDEGAPSGEPFELVTKTEDGAETASKEEFDVRTARTYYSGQNGLGWKLREPTSTVSDPASLDLISSTLYNETTGEVVETKAPASNTEVVYPPVFSKDFGSAGSGNAQFNHPEGLVGYANKEIAVDQGNDRFEEFRTNGTFISAYGSAGTGNLQFSAPFGDAVDPVTGQLYIADSGNNRIEVVTVSGTFVEAIGWGVKDGKEELETCTTSCRAGHAGSGNGEFNDPTGLTFDSAGDLWVTDTGNNRVQEISPEGTYMSQFGTKGSGNGQLSEPIGIAMDEGEVFVVDYGNDRVEEFSPSGAYLSQFGSKGSGAGQFNYPVWIVANMTSGDLYVSDTGNSRIQEWTPAGKFLTEIGSYGTEEGELSYPTGVALQGKLYVADQDNNRLSVWNAQPGGGARMNYANQFGSAGSGTGQFSYPIADAIDGHGNVWVSDYDNSRIEEFSAAGKFLAAYGTHGSGHVQFAGPTGMTVNQSTGNVYIGDCGNHRVEELNEKGEYVTAFGSAGSEPGEMGCPDGVKVDSSGHVWVVDGEHDRIEEYSSTGTFIATYGKAGSEEGEFNDPTDLAFSEGNVYVADTGNHRIVVLSATTGEFVGEFGKEGGGDGQFYEPTEIAADPAGNLYVVDSSNGRVQEFNAAGTFLTRFASQGAGEGQLSGPLGIAINAAGSMYVVDSANNRVEEWVAANEAVHDTKTTYYSAGTEASITACQKHPEWVDLPCQSEPDAQPESGMPALPETRVEYNMWDQPETVTETFGTGAGKIERMKKTAFDSAGRPLSTEEKSTVDETLPKVIDTYNETNGTLKTQSTTVKEATKTITSVYNSLGELETYTDAAGNQAKYSYDIDGRVTQVTDGSEEGKGKETYHYDETTGELTKLEDSAGDTYTAAYNVAGRMTSEGYPNGMTAYYTYNTAGMTTAIEYKKETYCTEEKEKCVWFKDSSVPSIHGETLQQSSTLSEEPSYTYDAAGRLTQVQEIPHGEGCKTRIYTYEEESNRTSLTKREPGTEGKCATEGGSVERHTYDSANQLTDPGVTYDAFGNTTALPAADAGEATLTSSYYVDNQVYQQTQSGKTIEYTLDPEERTLETIATGSIKTVLHYDGSGGAVAWASEPEGKWTRNIPGIGGELTATQTNTTAPILLLHDLQGNVVAEASINEKEPKLLKSYNSTEFGVPTKKEAPPKYAWLGAAGLTSELSSGTITQDGTSYVPQTGRPLQTQPVELPTPNKYYNAYQRPNAEGATWGPIASALRIAESKQAERAQEGAAEPPGAIPSPEQGGQSLEESFNGSDGGTGGSAAGANPCKLGLVFGETSPQELFAGGSFSCNKDMRAFKLETCILWEGLNEGHWSNLECNNEHGQAGQVFYGQSYGKGWVDDEFCPIGTHYFAWVWGEVLGPGGYQLKPLQAQAITCTGKGSQEFYERVAEFLHNGSGALPET
jgi:YD repeat-containing protein